MEVEGTPRVLESHQAGAGLGGNQHVPHQGGFLGFAWHVMVALSHLA